MTVRDLFNSIGVWLEHTFTQTVIPYVREVFEVLLFQKNWLDASLVSVISVIVIYGWVLGSLYNFITETLEHRKRYREDADYREYYDEKMAREEVERKERFEREHPPFAKKSPIQKFGYVVGFMYLAFFALVLLFLLFEGLFGFTD